MKHRDKLQHILVCCSIYMVAYYICANMLLSAGFALAIGISKEAIDEYRGGKWDNWDLASDCVGIAIGVIIYAI